MLLIASSNFSHSGLEVVANWIFSIEGLDLYKSLLEKLKSRASSLLHALGTEISENIVLS